MAKARKVMIEVSAVDLHEIVDLAVDGKYCHYDGGGFKGPSLDRFDKMIRRVRRNLPRLTAEEREILSNRRQGIPDDGGSWFPDKKKRKVKR